MSSYRNVVVKGDPITKERVAGGTITPGMLLALGSAGTVAAHGTAGGNAMKMFAVENSDIGNGVDDNYVANDQCKYVIARPGDEIQALLKNGQTVVVGDLLVSDGAGALQKYAAETESNRIDMTKTDTTISFTNTIYDTTVVGIALEAMTASGVSKILIEVA